MTRAFNIEGLVRLQNYKGSNSVSTKPQRGDMVLFEVHEHDLGCYGVRKLDFNSSSI